MAIGVLSLFSATADYPTGYYDSLEGKCGSELMRAVKSIVRNHTVISYGASTWNAFKDTDVRTVNGVDYWWDMYSNELRRVSDGRPDSQVMNIEHSVANSWWGGTKNDAYNDIVHLNPSDSEANSRKGNYPLAEISSVTWNNGVTFIGSPKLGQGGGAATVYEPADEYKGDFARVFMYMFTVYDDISWRTSTTNWMYDTQRATMLKDWAAELLVRWNRQDPPGEKEWRRNDGVYKNQRNRNPFIDLPELADHIWGAKASVPFSLSGETPDQPGDPQDPQEDVIYSWLSSTDSSMGDWKIENVKMPSASSYVWNWRSYNGNNYLNGSAFISNTPYEAEAYAWSPMVSFANVSTAALEFEHAAKFQTTIKSLCKLVVRDVDTDEIDELEILNWPSTGNWTFVKSGVTDLSAYAGRRVQIGFKYGSNTSGADTWEINNVKLTLRRKTSDIEIPVADEIDDSFLVEVWGNNICAPEGARIFDLNGREVEGRNLQSGIYIVVKPTFEKAVKVRIK